MLTLDIDRVVSAMDGDCNGLGKAAVSSWAGPIMGGSRGVDEWACRSTGSLMQSTESENKTANGEGGDVGSNERLGVLGSDVMEVEPASW
jgi:hypothetical protein